MCGRYELHEPGEIRDRFATENDIELTPRYNIAPTQVLPVITNKEHKTIELMRWGLVPSWAADLSIGYKMINARAETIDSKPSYKKAFRSQRCLVPATGFYEWKREGKTKIPYYFHLKDKTLFAFAGLYNIWHDKEGKEYKTYTIVTTTPNHVVEPIHDRMPVILKKEDEDTWVNPDIIESEKLKPLLTPYADGAMDVYEVSTKVNSPMFDRPEVSQPV